MKRVLVTGGAGFIGYYLAKHLADQNLNVTIVDNFTRGKKDEAFETLISRKHVEFINCDMTNKSEFETLNGKYDEIYHLAAINGTKNFYEIPQEVLRVNISALMNLLEWIDTENCGKFLFSSSSEAYAGTIRAYGRAGEFLPTEESIPLTIDDVFNPRYSYGGSKLIGEILTINFCRQKKVPFSIIRYHNIYAGRMGFDHVIPEFCKRIHEKENPFRIFGGEETRAFCYVDDATKATQMVMESEACNGEIVHIGNSNEEIKIIDMAKMLFEINEYTPKIDIKSAPQGCVQRRCPSTDKLKKLTGFEPKVPLAEGLKKINDWYMKAYTKG